MIVCQQNQWCAEGLRAAVADAARTRAAALILAGVNPHSFDLAALEQSTMESWLDAAIPAGAA